jgi:hypothetical protein
MFLRVMTLLVLIFCSVVGSPAQDASSLRKAAEKGDAKAQSELGSMFAGGTGGLKKDEKEAIKWLTKAANQKEVSAQLALGTLYLSKGSAESLKWLRAAAEQDSPRAQFYLGYIYERNVVGPPNAAEAIGWYRRALQQGVEEARKPLEALESVRLIPPAEAAANLLTKFTPIVPALAKAARVRDYVSFEIVVDVLGQIKSYRLIHGHPLLNQAAIDTIRPFRYKPFLVNGQPSEITTSLTIDYSFLN